MSPSTTAAPMSERKLLFLLGSVQFINIVDFMMVLPLGPDFARALAIPTSKLGLVAGVYTASAALSGLIAALFLDRFDRRRALFVAMLGLVTGTVAGGFATGLGSMLASRVLAGAFGGPATAIMLSILADAVPPQRRGRALGAVMGAFSAASVLGVPAGLKLAELGGWKTPFFVVAALGALIASAVVFLMPPMRGHLQAAGGKRVPARPLRAFLTDAAVLLSLTATAVTMGGAFAVIANLSAFLQYNLGYPRERLEILYMAGGLASFFSMRVAGWFVDRRGSVPVAVVGTLMILIVISLGFVFEKPLIPVVSIFMLFMIGNSTRVVALNALTTRVPPPAERGRFMSAQSAVQHLSTALGAGVSTAVLAERPDHSLVGMPTLAWGAIALSVLLPFLVAAVARRVKARDAAAPMVATV
jgi:predicted MFS family arabinose efflux permease